MHIQSCGGAEPGITLGATVPGQVAVVRVVIETVLIWNSWRTRTVKSVVIMMMMAHHLFFFMPTTTFHRVGFSTQPMVEYG